MIIVIKVIYIVLMSLYMLSIKISNVLIIFFLYIYMMSFSINVNLTFMLLDENRGRVGCPSSSCAPARILGAKRVNTPLLAEFVEAMSAA